MVLLHSTTFQLMQEELKELNTVSEPPKSYPNWMVETQMNGRYPQQ